MSTAFISRRGGYIGDAETAEKLATARTISLTGEATGETLFDGSEDAAIYVSIERLTNTELEGLLK